jgi:putative transposase
VNKKKVHRLWREEGLQVKARSPRKRAGMSTTPHVTADAPNVVWALDFQFDSTIDGTAVKIASMVDEHTRESLLHLAERSITADRLVAEWKAAGPQPDDQPDPQSATARYFRPDPPGVGGISGRR